MIGNAAGEFPRIDERFSGGPYRHGWLAGRTPEGGGGLFTRIVHVDHGSGGQTDDYVLADGDATSEPVFVSRAADAEEGDGWILAVVFRGAQIRSDLLVFDALHVSAGPVATVAIPHRVSNGFHGNWIAARELTLSRG